MWTRPEPICSWNRNQFSHEPRMDMAGCDREGPLINHTLIRHEPHRHEDTGAADAAASALNPTAHPGRPFFSFLLPYLNVARY